MEYKHVVFIDKPSGITTKECLFRVQKILGARIAGYTGILEFV